MDTRSAHALVHFGLGRRGQEPAPADPIGWLKSQLINPDPAVFDPPQTTARGFDVQRFDRDNNITGPQSRVTALARAESLAQLGNAITTSTPFRERLVWFWSNHFTVSRRQNLCSPFAGAYVQETIRQHVTGRFADLLLAVIRHPAMLFYLDNVRSAGPDSPLGRTQGRGLNENLARECLELHTVSPAAGYTQADVTSLARLLTGWSVDSRPESAGFRFQHQAHEPTAQTLMGQTFPPGEEGGVAALRWLADHPSTHRCLATKLTAHFVGDDPPPDAVRRIEGILRDSGGDLGAATAGLVDLPAAWTPGTKLRTPQEHVIACHRALDLSGDDASGNLLAALRALGQPFWTAPAPNGWSDRATHWATPAALMQRVKWSAALAGRIGQRDPIDVAETVLGPLLRQPTLSAMARAGSRRDALTMFFSSPEFLRR